ncbi:DNA cytosine methyltransferase [Brevibacillus laterosporus]|uniref:Cytosine-specific methyltransferase n=1 Tax=Brevibacillus laterosporus TaxID=1465 RepID=A0A518VEH3_BRELA|nr:DNA cytosine methyltransferase [Brevibacillus laterosporus]
MEAKRVKKPFTAIDLFCGVGGVSEALKVHFDILSAVEFDPIIAKSYEINHGAAHLQICDIRTLSEGKWNELVNIKKGELDLLVGTPPCQGFSKHSRKKTSENNDDRNNLIFEIIRVSNIFHPKFILFENVNNILNFGVFHSFIYQLANINQHGYPINPNLPSYHIRYEKVDALDYGVPQKRKRLILMAKRIDIFPATFAILTKSQKSTPVALIELNIWPKKNPAPKLGDYLKNFNLNNIKAGETDIHDPLHTACRLSPKNLLRIQETPKNGGSRSDWQNKELVLECHKKKNVSFGDVYGRMDFNSYAPTITCGCTKYSKGRFGHPIEDRAISLREAALIQTFPKSYKFTGNLEGIEYKGSKDKIATQIGNAFPVLLAHSFIEAIYTELELLKENKKEYVTL